MGGSVLYFLYRPIFINVTFSKNKAPYGPNIASYPVKVILYGTTSSNFELDNIASGQLYPKQLKFSVVDYDNQVTDNQISGTVSINSIQSGAKVLGRSSEGLSKGVATFSELKFVASPGSKSVPFSVTSSAIDTQKVLKQFGTTSIQEPFIINFRYCQPGEMISDNM